jgi:hypothetical protein
VRARSGARLQLLASHDLPPTGSQPGNSVLLYAASEFESDPARCEIEACVHLGAPDLTLMLRAHAKDTLRRRSRYATPNLHSHTHCPGIASWRDLRDIRTRTDFRFDELFFQFGDDFVILPETPATIYLGEFLALNAIAFSSVVDAGATYSSHGPVVPSKHHAATGCEFTADSP